MVEDCSNALHTLRRVQGNEPDKGANMRLRTRLATAGVAACALAIAMPLAVSYSGVAGADNGQGQNQGHNHGQIKHVLLISVDGMHQSDLD